MVSLSISDIARLNLVYESFGSLTANPYVETNLNNWFQFGGTLTRSTEQNLLKGASGKFVPNGTTNNPSVGIDAAGAASVIEGDIRTASAWVYALKPVFNVRILLQWRDSLGANLSQTAGIANLTIRSEWSLLTVTGTAPALATSVTPTVFINQSPPTVDDIIFVDAMRISEPPVGTTQHVFLQRSEFSNVDLVRKIKDGSNTLFASNSLSAAIEYHRFLIDVRNR